MRVLFLTTVLPSHKLHGSEIASQGFIDAISDLDSSQVSVVGYSRQEDGLLELSPQEILVKRQSVETKKAKVYAAFWLALSLLTGLPYSVVKYRSRKYIEVVKSLTSQTEYDIIIIDHAQMAWLIKYIANPNKLIFIAHNIEHELYLQQVERSNHFLSRFIYRREAALVQKLEQELANQVDEIWTLTQHDADYFRSVNRSGRVEVMDLPSGFASQHPPLNKAFDVGIIGSWSWKPNEEGLQWFLQTVYPLLPANISIHVAGRGLDWLSGKYPNVTYRGFVPDAQAFMAEARVIAIPTLSGGGIQIKTLDAIASGSRIVATPIALRGVSNPPQTVQVAQQPEDFAELLVTAISNPLTQQQIDDALTWFRDRQKQFLLDVATAIGRS